MTIKINRDLCLGCDHLDEPFCIEICPGNLIYKSKKANIKIRDEKACWDCGACIKECPKQAISMYLPAEVGGRGSSLTAKRRQDKILWNLKYADGSEEKYETINITQESVLNKSKNNKSRRKNYMIESRIGNRLIGDGHKCFISFEPGATHTGLESAKKLAKAAAEAGADAVKFQTIEADEIMGSKDLMIEYETTQGKKEESIYKALKRREMSFDEWRELKKYCDDLEILFISTPSGPRTVDLLADINVAAIKVSKSDINNRFLIKKISDKGLPVILDAREKFEDVEKACRICEDNGVEDIVIMHCPSGYPAEFSGINLKSVKHIRDIFSYPVAYSDHSVDMYMNFAALGMGVDFIEKTITLDKTTDAVEHYMSLEPSEMKEFVDKIRKAEEGFGDPRVIFNSRVKKQNRRSIMTAKKIKKGQTIKIDDLEFKRPGIYLSVERYEEVIGKKAVRDLEEDLFISENDYE
jgi:adenosine phosphosulfate reductase beta subunit